MQRDAQQKLDIDSGIDQAFRSLFVNYPSSCTSSLTNSESSAVTDTVSKIEEVQIQMNVKLTALAKEELLWWVSY